MRQLAQLRRLRRLLPAGGNGGPTFEAVSTPASLNGQELELFRVGDYGKKGKYSAADLQDLASRYTSSDQAGITIGHPASDSEPAWGWIKSLRFANDTLYGTPGDVESHFDGLVQKGAYKHRSIGIARGNDGKLRLRHVAFLGAVPPAVQGLRPASFSSDPYEEFALEGDGMADEKDLDQRIEAGFTKLFSNLFGKKQEPAVVDIEARLAEVKQHFSEEIAAERQKREAVEQQFADHKKLADSGSAQARAERAIAGLKEKGYWIPAYDKCGAPQLFAALAAKDETITFSDANKTEQKPSLLDALTQVFSAVGAVVPSGQRYTPQAGDGSASKAAPVVNGSQVDATSATFSQMVQEHADKNKLSYNVAYDQLVAQGKRPASGSAAAGAV